MSKRAPTSLNAIRQRLEHSLDLLDERKAKVVCNDRLLRFATKMHPITKRGLQVFQPEEIRRIAASEKVLHEVIEAHNARCARKGQRYYRIALPEKR